MTHAVATAGGSPGSLPEPFSGPWRGINRLFRRHRPLAVISLLGPAVCWMLLVYIASLGLLVASAFFKLDGFTSKPTGELTTHNIDLAVRRWSFVWVVIRSALISTGVTGVCLLVGLPSAFYIAKIARSWARRGLVVAMLMPLWAGYLVKGYAWKAMLSPAREFGISKGGGVLSSMFGYTPGKGYAAVIITLVYLWLPYMVLPIYAGLERLPASLLEASGDLGAKPLRTFTSVVIPLLVPSIAAGSIFTFSLSLGDYIMPRLVTEGKVTMVGSVIYTTLLAPNQPLAAAYTIWPLVLIVAYLLTMRRLGAFDSL
jgi:putative spermidine/putrescine transport system permease protein